MRLTLGFTTLALVLLSSSSAYAASLPAGCGDDAVHYKVKTEKRSPIPASGAGKAQFVFVEKMEGDVEGFPLSRFAIDGEWVGADLGDSYFTMSVAPGAHKVCASRQSGARENVGVVSVSATAGATYYFQFIITAPEAGAEKQALSSSLTHQYPGSPTTQRLDIDDTAKLVQVNDLDVERAMKKAQHSVFSVK